VSNKIIEIRIEIPSKQTEIPQGRVVIIFPSGLRLGGHTPQDYRKQRWFALKASTSRANQLAQTFLDAGIHNIEVTRKKVVF